MELQNFIKNVEELISSDKPNPLISFISNPDGFLSSLKSLNSMIGMSDFKSNIVSQIKYYFVNQVRLSKMEKSLSDNQMFHTVILGPPGSGKTTAAEILAEIWTNLGVLKLKKDNKKLEDSDVTNYKLRIKNELFFEKEKIDCLHQILAENKESFDYEIYNQINTKVKSLDFGIEYIINRFVGTQNRIIPEAKSLSSFSKDFIFQEVETIPTSSIINSNFIKLKRDDLIGKYVGQTAIKTREALLKGLDKIIFIDEAYELYNVTSDSTSDSFGMECLSTILNFMNEFSDRTIIIFAGYEDLLKKTIFRVQPGLERRIAWTFVLNPYNEKELVQIYEKQLREKSWSLENNDKILELFKLNKEYFKHGGGDTLRLTEYTKTVYSDVCFERLLQNKEIISIINYEIVTKAIEVLKETNLQKKDSKPPEGMYS
jgi:SpoVK/Ycf46/Vps4 family AAA+-type ATPase